jgi:hypothetical protein
MPSVAHLTPIFLRTCVNSSPEIKRPRKNDGWKVEPLPEASGTRLADLSASELIALVAEAHRRIGALEAQLGRATA